MPFEQGESVTDDRGPEPSLTGEWVTTGGETAEFSLGTASQGGSWTAECSLVFAGRVLRWISDAGIADPGETALSAITLIDGAWWDDRQTSYVSDLTVTVTLWSDDMKVLERIDLPGLQVLFVLDGKPRMLDAATAAKEAPAGVVGGPDVPLVDVEAGEILTRVHPGVR